jgi:hypothetical protein
MTFTRIVLGLALLAGALATPHAAIARERQGVAAHDGLSLATAAAQTWAADGFLVYLENDEPVDAHGAATRWGYLFYSPSRDRARAYSVRDGRIVAAQDLGAHMPAPPVHPGWIDSDAARRAADAEAAHIFGRRATAEVATMLLARGAFGDADPDPTSWTVVYRAPGAPALFVTVDAITGAVRRSWRG